MFILMRYVADEVEDVMSLVGTFDDRDDAAVVMRCEFESEKHDYETGNPYDSWEWAEIFDDSAHLKVEGMPLSWTWEIFDDSEKHRRKYRA